jgi:hypothetical protein
MQSGGLLGASPSRQLLYTEYTSPDYHLQALVDDIATSLPVGHGLKSIHLGGVDIKQSIGDAVVNQGTLLFQGCFDAQLCAGRYHNPVVLT